MDPSSETLATSEDTGTDPTASPPEALEALSAGIERGHHLALVAAPGAGLGRLYAGAAVRDLGEEPDGHALVLAATDERATHLARTIHAAVEATGLETVMWGERSLTVGDVVLGTPARLLADVRAGRLSLPDVRLLVLDGVAALEPDRPAVEALLQLAGEETRLIAVTHRRDEWFDDLLRHRLPRARRWPEALFGTEGERGPPAGPPLHIGSAPTPGGRVERVIALLHDLAGKGHVERVVVWCARAADVDGVETALAVEGFATGAEDAGVLVTPVGARVAGEAGASILIGLPRGAEELEGALGASSRRAAVVAPGHVRQLELLAERLRWPHGPLGDRVTGHRGEIARFRSLVEEALARLDLATATLLIEPLVERHGFQRIAAALAGLLRETGRLAASPPPKAPATTGAGRDAARAAGPAWTRLFVNIGKQDGVAPGDLVGAITGETSAAAAQIGKIEIRARFSLVDIDSMIVEEVIRELGQARIKGRDITVRRDRGR